jgi:hypothetical protein
MNYDYLMKLTVAAVVVISFHSTTPSGQAQTIGLENATTSPDPIIIDDIYPNGLHKVFSLVPDDHPLSFVNAPDKEKVQTGLLFTTGSIATTLESVIIPIKNFTAPATDFQLEVWSTAEPNGFWNTKLYTSSSGSLLNPVGQEALNDYLFLFDTDVVLNGSSQYWILLRTLVDTVLEDHSQAMWLTSDYNIPQTLDGLFETFNSDIGWTADGAYSGIPHGVDENNEIPPQYYLPTIWTITVSQAPEPSSALLVGLTGLLAVGRRRRHARK